MLSNHKYGPQLRMHIVHCSSQDEVFPITELQSRTIHTSGWQSAKYCEYPQELGFRFEGDVDVQHLRILCHEAKIPSRIEIFIAEATDEDRRTISFPTYGAAVFRRLGHINLASNEENNFAARELKTINVRRNAIYLKLIIRKNHSNLINVFNQVGIVALSAHGSVLSPFRLPAGSANEIVVGGDDEVPMEQIFVANRNERERNAGAYGGGGNIGSGGYNGYSSNSQGPDDTFGGTLDAITGRKVRELTLHKARAIEQEDYDLAKALKDQIALLKKYGAQIAELEAEKAIAVEAEAFDTAKQLKLQIDELRAKSNAKPNMAARSNGPVVVGGLQRHVSQNRMGHDDYDHDEVLATSKRAPQRPAPSSQPVAFDDMPAVAGGGKNGGAKAMPFDERPVGGAAKSPRRQEEDEPEEEVPKPKPKAAKRPVPAPQSAPRPTAGPSGNDELACTAKGEVDMNDETGGIIVKSAPVSVALGKAAPATSDKMPEWEKALNAVAVGLIGDQGVPESLPGAKLAEYKEYISVYGNFVTCCLFSKRWQLREAAIRTIISNEGAAILANDAPQGSQAMPTLLLYLGAKGYGVSDTLANVFFAACDVISQVVAGLPPKGPSLAHVTSSILPLLPELMLKAGDNNNRVREKAALVLMQIAISPIGADRISSAALAEPETGGSKKPLSHRIHLARISIVQSLIEELGLKGKSGLTVDSIMQRLCIPCLAHSHQDVREAAQKLTALLYSYSTPAVMDKHLSGLKPAQRQLIDEQISMLSAAGGPPAPQPGKCSATSTAANDGPAASASPVKAAARKTKAEPEMVSSSFSVGKGQESVLAAARAATKAQPPEPSPPRRDPSKVCQYCGKYDEGFTEETLDLHLVRDCPMLCPCPLCVQVTEISQLQPHLVNECDRRSLVKQCPICLEAVRAEDLEAHVAAAECIPASSKHSLCPLCHAKFPVGPEGWIKHFARAPGCPNNPRMWNGGEQH